MLACLTGKQFKALNHLRFDSIINNNKKTT